MLRQVEARHLVLGADAQAHDGVDDLQDHVGRHDRQRVGGQDRDDLCPQLPRIAEEQAVVTALVDRLRREQSRGERAPRAANAVHADDVERVVVAELRLEVARGVAHRAGDGADDERR